MTERIREFLRNRRSEGLDTEPCLVVDLDVVRDNYQSFAKALPDSRVFYAAVGQRLGKAVIVVAHDVEVDHEARRRGRPRGTARCRGPRCGGCAGIP